MITIGDKVLRQQHNFWNNCLFHPTDAVEDPWGKRILDRMASDGAIKTVRIYTMFEDIVYLGENGELQYDFRISDLRLDYLIEKGYNLLLAFGGIPDSISAYSDKISMSKNKLRYKGKMWNSSPPKDYKLWEEICYEYTKHNVERYGIDVVKKWHFQCFNEPDWCFFMAEYGYKFEPAMRYRLPAYCKLYEAFEHGVCRVSNEISIGGPALAMFPEFLGGFLDYVTEKKLKLDFVCVHNYGTEPPLLRKRGKKKEKITVSNNVCKHKKHLDIIKAHGYENIPIILDEWGMTTGGFVNREKYPELMCRETEVFSAYYSKLIHQFINYGFDVKMMMICLSGQHEMTEDFTGFRNFFTLNFIAKPIYNAHILASKLKKNLLCSDVDNQNIFVVPTMDEQKNYAILVSYSSENFEDNLPTIKETVTFEENIDDKQITVWCIDKKTTNPYRLYQKLAIKKPTENDIQMLREEGKLKPVFSGKGKEKITLELTSNATYLITVNE